MCKRDYNKQPDRSEEGKILYKMLMFELMQVASLGFTEEAFDILYWNNIETNKIPTMKFNKLEVVDLNKG